ncbi:ATP-grasp domain-containing protein [Bacillus glycinifermentans]|uniref:ATP-grasp domain-containing protein n=1 Tax=Bacillus glycinifermentans TaxID=1664069 RepID=A0A0T6BUI0_9BACI|nr:ATP-grasp domain-containing protein [Bacillus glycinifermentans]ATH92546.1 hypothetical protein COP00_07885 [Bacillus glycinifermentans]KRT95296.1 hypothetical protein AB447_212415 [Bacillus glycinifermentans]MEC0485100.1 ATP-grasp domain-containing protein [Bacillus glycinifermentans]MEC3605830.1 ATP-grasp domain-containing protein [Bacillus glycinifermentans]
MRILLIAARHNIVEAAKKLDYEVVLFENKHRLLKETLEIADETHVVDWENHDEVVHLAASIHKMKPFQAVFAFGEKGVLPAALIKEKLNILGNPLKPVELSKDKGKMRKLLNERGISLVRYAVSHSTADLKEAVGRIGLPCIIKPVAGTASSGVFKINTSSELDRLFKQEYLQDEEKMEVIVEEYLNGAEYSVESISFNGTHHIIGITEKFTTGEPSFIETGHFFPAVSLQQNTANDVKDLTLKVLHAIEHEIGPAHTEIKITADGPKVIETHTRPGGDKITELMKLSFGVDVFYETLKSLKGMETQFNPALLQYSGIHFNLFQEGIVTGISGLKDLQKHPNIVEAELYLEPGNEIKPVKDSLTRHGYTVFTAYSPDKLTAMKQYIENTLKVYVKS